MQLPGEILDRAVFWLFGDADIDVAADRGISP
jgi:hypothetical protein